VKVIIVDSGDGSCSDEYMAMLPEGITVRGHSLIKEEKQHPPWQKEHRACICPHL
jgi:hypothetical protein